MSRQPQFNSFALTDGFPLKIRFSRVAIPQFHDSLNDLNRMWSDWTGADGPSDLMRVQEKMAIFLNVIMFFQDKTNMKTTKMFLMKY